MLYSPVISSRLRYVAMQMVSMIPGTDLILSSDKEEALSAPYPLLNYSHERFDGAVNILPDGLCEETGVRDIDAKPVSFNGNTVLFASQGDDDMGFDPFAASFYMLSRYEEYLPARKDIHGRFQWKNSMVSRYGLEEEPLVDQWAAKLRKALVKHYPAVSFPEREFRIIPTIDIDIPWAYRNRSFWRTLGGFARSASKADTAAMMERCRVIFMGKKDPFDTYEYIEQIHRQSGIQAVFFFAAGRYSKYDKSASLSNPAYRQMIKNISSENRWGIHPSYRSYGDPALLKEECEVLAEITGCYPVRSRNHYLRFSFPDSCRMLEATGIKEDYTLGWAEMTGFRAGTCTPFRFYDLEKEEAGSLVLYPFQIMDGTLCDYMKLSPARAKVQALDIAARVRCAGGTLITLWHNESLSESGRWKNWKNVYIDLIRTVSRWKEK